MSRSFRTRTAHAANSAEGNRPRAENTFAVVGAVFRVGKSKQGKSSRVFFQHGHYFTNFSNSLEYYNIEGIFISCVLNSTIDPSSPILAHNECSRSFRIVHFTRWCTKVSDHTSTLFLKKYILFAINNNKTIHYK